ATQAASIQAQLAYSRHNEYEADRVGMQILAAAGMDPSAMPRFFERMLEQQRYSGDPPEFLLTHPLTAERVADSRARARSLSAPP
ncbi:MAG TPA: peptidase M48, partial [Alcanivorax sp.]|nr:peptidase M48 [Alcanivorax sp.]